jgi:putative GTP pyrophosphokinase
MESQRYDRILKDYEDQRAAYEKFARKSYELVSDLVTKDGIKVSSIEYRTKTIESLRGKLSRKDYAQIAELPDLVGLRVIVARQEDLDNVVKILRAEFDVEDEASTDAAARLAPHEFGYLSVHLVIQLTLSRSDLSEWSFAKGLRAEIQIRTIAQHAWASISHALQYKHESDVPTSLRRRLHRVAALLELNNPSWLSERV